MMRAADAQVLCQGTLFTGTFSHVGRINNGRVACGLVGWPWKSRHGLFLVLQGDREPCKRLYKCVGLVEGALAVLGVRVFEDVEIPEAFCSKALPTVHSSAIYYILILNQQSQRRWFKAVLACLSRSIQEFWHKCTVIIRALPTLWMTTRFG